jgi:hypothetical protein
LRAAASDALKLFSTMKEIYDTRLRRAGPALDPFVLRTGRHLIQTSCAP